LKRAQQHGKPAEESVRDEVPLHWREVLSNLRTWVQNMRVLHIGDEHGKNTEDHEEDKFGL
jgi:hypothetical protein